MIVNYDLFDKQEMPYILLTNPDKTELYSLSGVIYKTKLIKRFNGLSEFEFTVPSTIDNGITWVECYESVQAKRLISIQNEGYFIIDNVEETSDGQNHIKVVKSKSLEAEMLSKRFNSFDGTFKFYDLIPVSGRTTVMDTVIALLPTWTVGIVDLTISAKYRTFNITDSTVYGFLINDCEKAFECIFVFDTILKTINVYSTTSATTATDIYLSYDNLIKNSSFTEISDEVATSLYCTGGGTLGINLVNPLGTNKIYDFTYYKNTNWMTQGLVDAVTAWELLVVSNQAPYAALLTDYRIKNLELITLQNELVALNERYTIKETEQKVRIQAKQSISGVNAMILTIRGWIDAKQAQITAKQAELTAVITSVAAINTALSFAVNFTTAQYKELSEFIYENSYQNSNLIVTDQSTAVDYQDTSQELYDQSKSVLSRSSLPRYEFTMNTANFVAMKEYAAFTGELVLGSTVTVNVNDNFTVVPILLEITMSYDDPSQFSLTFGNRLRLDNGNYQYADLIGQVVSTGSSVAGNADQWSNWDKNYKDSVSTFITSSLNASLNAVINATNQEIIINTNGLRGKTEISAGVYDPRQVWLTSSMLAFTDDNWNTAKLALGQIEWNGNIVYGLVADTVVGKLLAGNQLTITNEGSNFTLDQNGAKLNNASFLIQNNNTAIVMTPTEETINGIVSHGISIQSKASGIWENVFYTDSNGNLIIKGTFSVTNGDLGGWHINSNGLYDDLGNYIYSNGNVHLGGMVLEPGSARFTGNLYATNLYGRIVGAANYMNASITPAAVSFLNAGSITAGKMSGERIYGGLITGPDGFEMGIGWFGRSYIRSNNRLTFSVANGVNSPAIDIGNGYMYLGSTSLVQPTYVHLDGITEFHKEIRVTNGGVGVTKQFTIGGSVLKFARGILVDGNIGDWGDSGTGTGGNTGGIGGVGTSGDGILIWSPATISNGTPSIAYKTVEFKAGSTPVVTIASSTTTAITASDLSGYAIDITGTKVYPAVIEYNTSTGLIYMKFSPTNTGTIVSFTLSVTGITSGISNVTSPGFTEASHTFSQFSYYGSTTSLSDVRTVNNPSGGIITYQEDVTGQMHWVGTQWRSETRLNIPALSVPASLYVISSFSRTSTSVIPSIMIIPVFSTNVPYTDKITSLYSYPISGIGSAIDITVDFASPTLSPGYDIWDFTASASLSFVLSSTLPTKSGLTLGTSNIIGV